MKKSVTFHDADDTTTLVACRLLPEERTNLSDRIKELYWFSQDEERRILDEWSEEFERITRELSLHGTRVAGLQFQNFFGIRCHSPPRAPAGDSRRKRRGSCRFWRVAWTTQNQSARCAATPPHHRWAFF